MPPFALKQPPDRIHGRDETSTWKQPPIDGSLTIPQIYEWHLKHNPTHPVFHFPDLNGGIDKLCFSDVVPAAHRAARFVGRVLGIDLDKTAAFPTIAIVAELGLVRAGIPVFPINPRQPVESVTHLLNSVSIRHVFVGPDAAVAEKVRSAIGERSIAIVSLPTYTDLYGHNEVAFLPERIYDYSAPAVITCSSGSAGLPKPVVWNYKCNLQTGIAICYGEKDLCNQVVSTHAMPSHQGIGINFISWLAMSGMILSVYPPASPRAVPQRSFDDVLVAIQTVQTDYVILPPAVLEVWCKDEAKADVVCSLKGIIFGGVPLDKQSGDSLVARGATLLTTYGLTECGVVGTIYPENRGYDWNYFTINGHCGAELLSRGDGTAELIIVESAIQELTIPGNMLFHGRKAYATGDILASHPTKRDLWKVVGRTDDAIISNTGDITNTRYLENILGREPRAAGALITGHGRDRISAIIDLKPEFAFDDSDASALCAFRDSFVDTLESMNAVAPAHAQLTKDMIIPSKQSKPFVYTLKGPAKRALSLRLYEEETEALYNVDGRK